MSILLPVHCSLGDPFADYLNVTYPFDFLELVHRELRPLLDMVGASAVSDELYQVETKGTLKLKRRGQVGIVSASGAFLDHLRRVPGAFREYLAILGLFPYRVSMVHVTQDYLVASPPDVINQVRLAAVAGDVSLTRKSIKPSQVNSLLSVDLRGSETGTVYLGQRQNADVWAKIYDKRHERESRGFGDPGPIVRVEIACQSDVGVTLKDVESPAPLFYHFASRSLCERPEGVAAWSPQGEGYVLPVRQQRTAIERIDSILEASVDMTRVLDLAFEAYGEGAWEVVMPSFRRRFRSRGAK